MTFYRCTRQRTPAPHSEELVTKQAMKAECDINRIVAAHKRTGFVSHVSSRVGFYADLPQSLDYHEALERIRAAEASFAGLPASVRDHFGNDPGAFLQAIQDSSRLPELRELGLTNTPLSSGRSDEGQPAPAPGGSAS